MLRIRCKRTTILSLTKKELKINTVNYDGYIWNELDVVRVTKRSHVEHLFWYDYINLKYYFFI